MIILSFVLGGILSLLSFFMLLLIIQWSGSGLEPYIIAGIFTVCAVISACSAWIVKTIKDTNNKNKQ